MARSSGAGPGTRASKDVRVSLLNGRPDDVVRTRCGRRIYRRPPSARPLARLMTVARDQPTRADTVTVAAIEMGVPGLADARSLVERFGVMVSTKAIGELDGWIEQAKATLIAPLARGVARDKAAVRAAITEPWSNGQTEGQINRLKLIKRQMYGRAKLDLLEARLISAA